MPLTGPATVMFSTQGANDLFAAKFTVPLRAALTAEISDSGFIFEMVGRLWSSAELALEQLPEGGAHKSTIGASLADDVKEAVIASTQTLWQEIKPKVTPASGEPFTLSNRLTSFEKSYKSSLASARAAVAANRAAAAAHFDPPTLSMAANIGTPDARAGPRQVESDDVIEMMLARMNADTSGNGTRSGAAAPPGPGNAAALTEAPPGPHPAPVPPALTRACKWITDVGVPPLRVEERYSAALAMNILKSSHTFTEYAEKSTLKGGQLREAMTLARILDVGTEQYGPGFLISDPAEVALRRFVSLMLACKQGNFTLAQDLEELPSDSALSVLPETVMGKMYQKLKLRSRLGVDAQGRLLDAQTQAMLLSHTMDTQPAATRS